VVSDKNAGKVVKLHSPQSLNKSHQDGGERDIVSNHSQQYFIKMAKGNEDPVDLHFFNENGRFQFDLLP
jgi:hypothetical protein